MAPPAPTQNPTARIRRRGRLRRCLILDDRGRDVELLDPFRLYLSGRDDAIERPVLKSIIDACSEGGSRKLQLSLLFAGAFFVAMALFAFWPEYRATGGLMHSLGEAARSPVVYFALGYGVLVIPWQLQAERRIRRRHITKALLERRRCAHCGYNLAGLETDAEDGAIVCPECACAWKLDEASVSSRAGDEEQARREMIRFGLIVGIVMTIVGLMMALYYVVF
ncbi:MAG: hypothetical protein ACYTGG_14590 [Planctomycetota bacterium]|jgi:hypothetical protein